MGKLSVNPEGFYLPPEDDLALADEIANLSSDERESVLRDIPPESLMYDFNFWGRKSQLVAIKSTAWLTVALSGRGWGKTRTLAEWIHRKAMENPGCRIALVGRVTSDVRDVIIMGESGILAIAPPGEKPRFVATHRRVIWPNGSEALTFSADIASQLRGPQFHFAAADELASWRVKPDSSKANAWDNLKLATRLGDNPQIFVATTPRRVPMILDVLRMASDDPGKVLLIRGSTFANRHLANVYLDTVKGLYEGTHLGAQELHGELMGDLEGALLRMETIDAWRQDGMQNRPEAPNVMSLPLRVVGVDPTVSDRPKDECGILVIGSTAEKELYRRHVWVYEDATVSGSPETWAKAAVAAARKYSAPIVAERNQGGELVRMIIKAQDPEISVTLVQAQHGKMIRAEPVVLAYEQGRVHHTDYFPELEDQLTGWLPEENRNSPDRLDALVHAITAATVKVPSPWVGNLVARAARGRMPLARRGLGTPALVAEARAQLGKSTPIDVYAARPQQSIRVLPRNFRR